MINQNKEKINNEIIETIKEEDIDINTKIGLAKEELNIALDSSKYFKDSSDIVKKCINTNTIHKIRILIGSSAGVRFNGTKVNNKFQIPMLVRIYYFNHYYR